MNEDHEKRTVTCITCLGTYCSGCDSDCPSCCIHRHCQAQLTDEKGITDTAIREMEQVQEELLVAKRNAESWQETAQQAQEERYLPLPCPNCKRVRVLYAPSEGTLHCEKCEADTNTLISFQEELQQAQKELTNVHECNLGLYATIEGLEEERDKLKKTAYQLGIAHLKEIKRAYNAEKQLRLIVSEAEGMPEEGLAQAIERAESAEAKLLEGGNVVFTGLSVPKSRLDEAVAEHAKETTELWERIRVAEEKLEQREKEISNLHMALKLQEEEQYENETELVDVCIWNLEQCPGAEGYCNDVTRVHDRLLRRREELTEAQNKLTQL